jgi:aminomethyltransferase
VKFLESVVVGDISALKEEQAILSLITDESGGIIDDTVISHAGDHIYMVINGATKVTDLQHFSKQIQSFEGDVHLNTMDVTHQLLALQGSGAAAALQPLLPSSFDLSKMAFMTGVPMTIDGVEDCRVTRYVAALIVLLL